MTVLEIGGGYGGQALIISYICQIFNIMIKKYTIIDLDSITQLATLDKESETEAQMLFNYLRMNGKCGSYNRYVPVFLEKFEFAYTDTSGLDIEVWKLHKQNMWSLIQKAYVKRIGLTL